MLDQLSAGAVGIVAVGPVNSQAESLISPGEEADALNNGRLDNLLAGEDTPGDGVGTVAGCVGLQVAGLGDGVVSEARLLLDSLHQLGVEVRVQEQLKVGLLVDIAVWRTPAVSGVG